MNVDLTFAYGLGRFGTVLIIAFQMIRQTCYKACQFYPSICRLPERENDVSEREKGAGQSK